MTKASVLPAIVQPSNQDVLGYLRSVSPDAQMETAVGVADHWQLGTHPDLVDYFYYRLGKPGVPEECARVIYSQPVLAHEESGKIFALAGGTGTLAMRLSAAELREANAVVGYGKSLRYPNTELVAEAIGTDWAFVDPFSESAEVWIRAAHQSAAS